MDGDKAHDAGGRDTPIPPDHLRVDGLGLPTVWTNGWAFYQPPDTLPVLVDLVERDGKLQPGGKHIASCATKARIKATRRTCIILNVAIAGKRPKVLLTVALAPEPKKDQAASAPTVGEYELWSRVMRADLCDYELMTAEERDMAAKLCERLAAEKPQDHEKEKRSWRKQENGGRSAPSAVAVSGKRKRTPPRRYAPPLPSPASRAKPKRNSKTSGKGGKGKKSTKEDNEKPGDLDAKESPPKKARIAPAAQVLRGLTTRQAFRLGELSARAKHCADAAAQSSYELSATLAAILG